MKRAKATTTPAAIREISRPFHFEVKRGVTVKGMGVVDTADVSIKYGS